jgi:hypothetical protein
MTVLLSAQEMRNLHKMEGLVNLPTSIVEAVKEFNHSEYRWRNDMDMLGTMLSYIEETKKVEKDVLEEVQSIIPLVDKNIRVLMHGHTDLMIKVIETLNGIGHRTEFINSHPEHELVSKYFEDIEQSEQLVLTLTNDFLEVV